MALCNTNLDCMTACSFLFLAPLKQQRFKALLPPISPPCCIEEKKGNRVTCCRGKATRLYGRSFFFSSVRTVILLLLFAVALDLEVLDSPPMFDGRKEVNRSNKFILFYLFIISFYTITLHEAISTP